MSRVRVPSATRQAGRHFRLPAFAASFAVRVSNCPRISSISPDATAGIVPRMTAIYVDTGQELHRRPAAAVGATRGGPARTARRSLRDNGKRCAAKALASPFRDGHLTRWPSGVKRRGGALVGRQMLALPAFHCSHGMFQSPSPSVPGSVEPTVFTTSTMSPRFVLS